MAASATLLALFVIALVAEEGKRLRAMFISGCVGSVTAILILTFTPVEYRFYGMAGVTFFASIYWLAPLLNTLRALSRDRDFVRAVITRKQPPDG